MGTHATSNRLHAAQTLGFHALRSKNFGLGNSTARLGPENRTRPTGRVRDSGQRSTRASGSEIGLPRLLEQHKLEQDKTETGDQLCGPATVYCVVVLERHQNRGRLSTVKLPDIWGRSSASCRLRQYELTQPSLTVRPQVTTARR